MTETTPQKTPQGIGFRQIGNGPVRVLVLHGWFTDSTGFAAMFPYLNEDTFTYVFLDHRGYGNSKALGGKYTIEEMGQDALAVAAHLGWDRFFVIGHSMGGMVAQWLAVHAADSVTGIIGINPVPACGFPFDADTEALFQGAIKEIQNREMILNHTTGGRLISSFAQTLAARSQAVSTQEAFAGYLTAWSKSDFSAQMKGIALPCRLLVGAHDPVVTTDLMKQTIRSWWPQATLQVIENAGHYPMVETPLALVTEWETFLRSPQTTLAPMEAEAAASV